MKFIDRIKNLHYVVHFSRASSAPDPHEVDDVHV